MRSVRKVTKAKGPKGPSEAYVIYFSPTGEALRGECLLCNRYFYTTLNPDTAVAEIMRQIYSHLEEKHGPFNV